MKAMVCEAFGGPEVLALREVPDPPPPGPDEIQVRIGGLSEANPAQARANMKALVELAAQGKLKPRISHRFRLDQAAEALRAVIDRAVIGKAVLVS